MRKFLIIVAIAAGCRNDAITYMHAVDRSASCVSINTDSGRSYVDTATCVSGGRVLACMAPSGGLPTCEDRGPVVVEKGITRAERIWP